MYWHLYNYQDLTMGRRGRFKREIATPMLQEIDGLVAKRAAELKIADARDYQIADDMLRAVGISDVCLLTNNPDKVSALQELGITVSDRMPLVVGINEENRAYLETKATRMGHEISQQELEID